jgi:hypothetical protein
MRFHLTKPVPACRMGSLGCLLQGLERMGGQHSAASPVTPGARRAVASGRRRGTQGPLPPAAGGAAHTSTSSRALLSAASYPPSI